MWKKVAKFKGAEYFHKALYINDVALAAGDSLIHLYADDTILYTSGPSLDTVLKPVRDRGQYFHFG